MNKAILRSLPPQQCARIANGEQTIILSKTKPKLDTPHKEYIYCTKTNKYLLDREANGTMFCWDEKSHHYPFKYEEDFQELFNGKVIGEFVCDRIDKYPFDWSHFTAYGERHFKIDNNTLKETCLSRSEFDEYGNSSEIRKQQNLYGLHISQLKIYDKPKTLGEFRKPCSYAPTALCYPENCELCPWNVVTRPPRSRCYVQESDAT